MKIMIPKKDGIMCVNLEVRMGKVEPITNHLRGFALNMKKH
jgi:hypothetical protein